MDTNETEIEFFEDSLNPLDSVEEIFLRHDWAYERSGDSEVTVQVQGQYGQYKMLFVWQQNFNALQLCCACDIHIPLTNLAEACKITNKINASLWLGHFDIRTEEGSYAVGVPCFRHTSLFAGLEGSGIDQMESLIDIALHECERFHLSFALLGNPSYNKTADMALALMDVAGRS